MADPIELPQRQADLMLFMDDFIRARGRAPTHREIAAGLGLKTSNPGPYIRPLLGKGLLKRRRTDGRLYFSPEGDNWIQINRSRQMGLWDGQSSPEPKTDN